MVDSGYFLANNETRKKWSKIMTKILPVPMSCMYKVPVISNLACFAV